MKRVRNFVIVFAIFCLCLFFLVSFLNVFYLPKKAKALVVKAVEEQTGLKVELPRLSFHLLKGVTLEELKLRDLQGNAILFQARRVYVQHFWLPLLLKKEFIASSVTFERPSFSIIRFQDGRWNLEPLWQKTEQRKQIFALIPRLSIVQGEVLFTDQTVSATFSRRVTHLNGKVYVGLPAHLYWKGSFGLYGSPVSVTFTGSHPLNKETWSFRCAANHFSLSDVAPYAKTYLPFLEFAEGDLSFESRHEKEGLFKAEKILFDGKTKMISQGIRGEAHLSLAGRFSYQGKETETVDYALKGALSDGILQVSFLELPLKGARGEFSLKKDTLSLDLLNATLGKATVSLKGTMVHFQDPELDFLLSSQSDIRDVLENLPHKNWPSSVVLEGPVNVLSKIKGKMSAPSLSGSLEAHDVAVKGIPSFGTIEHLRGSITVTEKTLETDGLTGQHQGFPFELKGTLSDFQNPLLDLRIRMRQPLESLEKSPLLQTLSQNFRPSLEGWGQWDLKIKGPFNSFSQKDVSGTCHLQNASLKIASLPSAVEKIDGEFTFDAQVLTAKGLTGSYAGNSFRFDGSLQQGQNPKVEFSLATKTFQLSSRFSIQGKDLRPFTLHRRTAKSNFSAEGEILNYEKPMLRLSGRWEGPMEELEKLKILGEASFLADLKGMLATQFTLSGPKDHPESMTVSGEFSSPLLTYKSFKFRSPSSHYAYQDKVLTLSRFSSTLWGGRLLGEATLHLSEDRRYTSKIELTRAKLSDALQNFKPEQKGFRGFLSVMLQSEGEFADIGNMVGEGWFKIDEGDLFQFPLLAGLTPVLRPIISTLYPELDERIAFQEAYAHFDIKDRVLSTENLILKGDRAILYGQGSVGFNQLVDFRIGVQFTDPKILERPTKISQLKNIFISDAGMLSGEVRVHGTLSQPKYRYVPLPLNRIQNVFRGIFQ